MTGVQTCALPISNRIKQGKFHVSGGCVELSKNDAIWFFYNASPANTTSYIWTEKPATSKDTFQNTKLKNIMIKKGYTSVSQLTEAEKSYVYK